jgi:hypothetical protein
MVDAAFDQSRCIHILHNNAGMMDQPGALDWRASQSRRRSAR